MKRTVFIVARSGCARASSVAVATLRHTSDLSPVSATLSAPTTVNVSTRTLTCDAQTIEITDGRYTGTATSTTAGSGPARSSCTFTSVYNMTRSSAGSTAG